MISAPKGLKLFSAAGLGLDIRSLALYRVAVGVLFLGAVWMSALLEMPIIMALLLQILCSGLALALILGYRTRWVTVVAWLVLFSLNFIDLKNLGMGNYLLRMLVFWGLFLPLGATCSLDSALGLYGKEPHGQAVSGGIMGLFVQLAFLAWVFASRMFGGGFGGLDSGLFFGGYVVGLIAFLPGWIWDTLATRIQSPYPRHLTIYYDGECGFCLKLLAVIRTFLAVDFLPMIPAQQDPDYLADMNARNSWIVADESDHRWYQFQALVRVVAASPVAWPWVRLLEWAPVCALGTHLYAWVAEHRMPLSRSIGWLRYRPNHPQSYRVWNALAFFCVIWLLLSNLPILNPALTLPPSLETLARLSLFRLPLH